MATIPTPNIKTLIGIGEITANNTIVFDPAKTDKELLGGANNYVHLSFSKYQIGALVKCTFSLRNKNKNFLTSQEIRNEKKQATPVEYKQTKKGRYIAPDLMQTFSWAKAIAAKKGICNLMLLGGSGYGKTSICEWIAEEFAYAFHKVDCSMVRDSIEWFGSRELVEKNGATETKFVTNKLTETLISGNAIICFDEINRTESWILNGLMQLLQFGKTVVDGIEINLGKNIIFAATANVGWQYVATFQMDRALENRFAIKALVSQMPETNEISVLVDRTGVDSGDAQKIVKVARQLRDKPDFDADVSHRVTLQVAELVSVGADVQSAYMLAVGNILNPSGKTELINALKMPVR